MRVLVVEDYPPIRKAISKGLYEAAFTVDSAANGTDGLWYATSNDYDIVILDLMLPEMDGMHILRELRRINSPASVIMLTAKDALPDRIAAFKEGADDYLLKPFAFEELLARVNALARRRYQVSSHILEVGNLEINTSTQQVSRGGIQISLTRLEYALLHYLVMRKGELVTRREIWENIYDFNSESHSNVVEVYIRYLRKKIEREEWPRLIHTRRGFGYQVSEEAVTS